ncbi:MAG: DUF624 domain-containing protein, partial [Clostridiales bacterium]|nr:DUF624 domain-containing protein [Clostridiales bacterium]
CACRSTLSRASWTALSRGDREASYRKEVVILKRKSDSPVLNVLGDIADLLVAGFLWLLCSIPIVTTGAASSALYYTVVKVVRRKRETVTKAFFYSFKANLGQGCAATIILGLYALLIFLYVSLTQQSDRGPAVIIALLILVIPFLLICMYIFPVISRFQNRIWKQFQYALYLSLMHPLTTILLLLWSLAAVLLIYVCTFLIGILPGIYTFVCSLLIERVFKKHMKNQLEQIEDKEDIPWYLE